MWGLEPYKDEKYFNIFDKVGLQTYEDAEKLVTSKRIAQV
jgi:hypothetical protein